jgi:hypothetical protein
MRKKAARFGCRQRIIPKQLDRENSHAINMSAPLDPAPIDAELVDDEAPVVAELVGPPPVNPTRRSSGDSPDRTSSWKSRIAAAAKLVLVGFLLLSTFAFLTTGMSEVKREAGSQPTRSSTPGVVPAAVLTEIANPYSETIREQWQQQIDDAELIAAPPADWLTVCRRLSLGLVGSGLSLEEIRSLESLPEHERVARHRDALLNDPRFHDYWAERFTRFYVGADDGPFLVYRRRRFRTWLSDELAANTRYDVLVRKLITAKGVWTDRPEVNFYTVTFDSGGGQPDPIRMAARTCRAFLGIRIDCLQCHNDFLGNVSMGDPLWMDGNGEFREGTQQDFHALAAFFTAVDSEGLQGLQNRRANYKYQYLDADSEQAVAPEVPFRRDLLTPRVEPAAVTLTSAQTPSSDTEVLNEQLTEAPFVNERQRLAQWITHPENVQFARATVTRVWALLLGAPPADAVDDLPLDSEPSPLMMTLSQAFIESGFDMRFLIRLITDSPAFQVDSRSPSGDESFEITARHERAMAAFPIVRLRAEQVAGAAIQAGRVKTLDRETSLLLQLQQFGDRNDFLRRYGDLGEDEFENETITITQRLTMLNGKLTSEVASWNPVLNTSAHVGLFAQNDERVVEALYLANLNRYPTDAEREHFARRLGEADSRQDAIVDIVWVLLNSSEFAWNH